MPKELTITRDWSRSMAQTLHSKKANFIAVYDKSKELYVIKNKQLYVVADYGFNNPRQRYEIAMWTSGVAAMTFIPELLVELAALCNACYKQFPKLTTTQGTNE